MTDRGFTGHEHMDQLKLIHMNGRLQDPVIGRMLSPDLVVQALASSQSLNRYSYVLNNPLSLADPSGYCAVAGGPASCTLQQDFECADYGGSSCVRAERIDPGDFGPYGSAQFESISNVFEQSALEKAAQRHLESVGAVGADSENISSDPINADSRSIEVGPVNESGEESSESNEPRPIFSAGAGNLRCFY